VLRQDVGRIDATGPAGALRRYFIVNASLGVTAGGNEVFNRERGAVALLKRFGSSLAIPAAALLAIARHSNIDATVSFDAGAGRPAAISNLAILKNPSISGPLRVPVESAPDDGKLGVWLEDGLSRASLLGLFLRLAAGRYVPGSRTTIARCASVRVRARAPFTVEYDGEILRADDVTFRVEPRTIGVCQ
jgi:diacylglycerol kinase family enzyme